MYGMVYNDDNVPVPGAVVSVNGRAVSLTDTQGRFILQSRQRNLIELSLDKPGYEAVRAVFRFEPMDVIHLTLVNAAQLVSRAELAMDEGRYEEAELYCTRALALDPGRLDAPYLKALSLIRQGRRDAALALLEELKARVGEKEYLLQVMEGGNR
jgi:tetratricopeptide (TPR) repeat protein